MKCLKMKTGVILAVFYPLFVSNLIGNNYMNMAYKYQKSKSGTVRGIHLLFMCGGNLGDDK